MLNQILRKIKRFGQEINQQNKNCCHLNRQVKLLGAAAIMLTGSISAEAGKLNGITQGDYDTLQQKKQSIIRSKESTLAHHLASAGDHLRSSRLADATNSLDRALDLLHDYPSLRGNETHDLDTHTTLSMLSESAVSTQTEVQVKEAEVQVSSTDSAPISSTFVQTLTAAL